MKKISMMLAAVAVMAFASCGDKNANDSDSAVQENAEAAVDAPVVEDEEVVAIMADYEPSENVKAESDYASKEEYEAAIEADKASYLEKKIAELQAQGVTVSPAILDALQQAQDKVKEFKAAAKEKADEMGVPEALDAAKEKVNDLTEAGKEKLNVVKEAAKEKYEESGLKDAVEDAKEAGKEKINDMKEAGKEKLNDALGGLGL